MHASSPARRRTTIAALVAATVTALSACGGGASGGSAAQVGSESVRIDSVLAAVDRGLSGAETLDRAKLTREHLTTLVRLELVRNEARKRNIAISDEDINKTWAELENQKGRAALETAAAGDGVAAADLAAAVEMTTYVRVISERLGTEGPVTDAELDEFRKANADRLADQAQAAHILVQDEALAKKLLADIKAGADFAALAKQHNSDSTKDTGGDLGVAPRGKYVAPFEEALWSANKGDVVGPVKTEFGYHLIKVIEIQRFEDIKEKVRAAAASSIGNARAIMAFRTGAPVTVNPRFGRWDPDGIQVVPTEAGPDDPSAPKQPKPGKSVLGTDGFDGEPSAESPAQ
ncbi:MAG: peptidylprolyl isomerase [Mycobacteriales bacterium]